VYGCGYSGAGVLSTTTGPELELRASPGALGSTIGSTLAGNLSHSAAAGSSAYGYAGAHFQVAGSAGTNTYIVVLDDVTGGSWCMDFAVYAELLDNTAPSVCLNVTTTTSSVTTTMVTGLRDQTTGITPIEVTFANPYVPREVDLIVASLVGVGGAFVVPGSLRAISPTQWAFDLGGALPGERYSITVDGSLPDLCGTVLTTGSFSVDVIDVRCSGAQPTAVLDRVARDVSFDPMAALPSAVVPVAFDQPFALEELDISITPTNGGSGFVAPGTLVRLSNTLYTFELQGVVNGDTYQVTIAGRTDMCGTMLAAGTFSITLTDAYPSMGGVCPFPALPNTFAAPEACQAPALHNSVFSPAPSAIVLANAGDQASVTGTFTAGNFDQDFFSFQLNQVVGNINEVRVSIAYGCNLVGTANINALPEVSLWDVNGNLIDSFQGDLQTLSLTGTRFGHGAETYQLVGLPGPTTYLVGLDLFDFGALWCLDYAVYLELIDNTKPQSCFGTPGVIAANTSGQSVGEVNGAVTARVDLNGPFPLTDADVMVTPTSGGAGAMVPGSLQSTNNINWTFDVVGVMPGESYRIDVMSRTALCSTLQARSIPLSIIDGRCLGAQPGAIVQTQAQVAVVDTLTGTARVPVVFDAPFFLQESDLIITPTSMGAAGVLVPGSLQRTGPSNAPSLRYTFEMSSVMVGEAYSVTINGRTDLCMTSLNGGTYYPGT